MEVLQNLLQPFDLVLASGSPRRKMLLEEMELVFRVDTRPVEEVVPPEQSPEAVAMYLSNLKANAFETGYFAKNTLVITADTVVAAGSNILGKPSERVEAIDMLQQLSGKKHLVITGVTLRTAQKEKSFFVSTEVFFKLLSPEEITFYVDNYKPFDKAGAYGIQEWIGHAGIEKINGSYFNVVGLPTHRLYEELLLFITDSNV